MNEKNNQFDDSSVKASLGLVTRLMQEHLMPKAQPEASQTPNTAPGQEQTQEPGKDPKATEKAPKTEFKGMEDRIINKIEETQNNSAVKQELNQIREELNQLLQDGQK